MNGRHKKTHRLRRCNGSGGLLRFLNPTIVHNILIDSEFQALIPPLSAEERAQLEANLLADGCRDPLVVWVQPAPEPGTHKCYAHDESKRDLVPEDDVWHCRHCEHNPAQQEYVLIDGHNRYEICTRNGIEHGIEEMLFDSRSDVVEWIIKNQFGRRNLSDYQRGVLALRMKPIIAKRAEEKMLAGVETNPSQKSDEGVKPIRTDEAVSELAHISRDTIRKIERIEEVAQPEVKALASAGEVSINLASQFTELPQEVQQEAIAAIAEHHEPAKEVMREAVKKAHVANNSGNNEWYTPADYIALAREVMGGIDTDPATSEIANRTVQASQIFTAEDNGLTKQWSAFKWLNPAPCNCGVAPTPIESGDGYENLPELSKSLAAHVGLLLAESGDAISGFLVQRLQPRKVQEAPSRTPRRPGAAVEVVGREGEAQPEPEGRRGKAFAEPYRQSEAACKDYRNGFGVDCGGVEPDAGGMGARLCLLREDGSAVDAGSLHSYLSSCVAGDGARKHGSFLPELQFQQGASDAGRVARGQASYCPNCGVAGYALVTPSRVFLNPPYAQPLIAEFAEAIASKYESGEIEQACVLVNNGTETAWFQRMLKAASAVCFPRSRIRFVDPEGNPSGAPLQGQAVLYLGDETEAFASVFSEKGAVLFNA